MANQKQLSDAIQEYLAYRKGAGYRPNTVRVSKQGLDHLLACLGNVSLRKLEPIHGERFYAYLAGQALQPRSVNAYLVAASTFFKWCRTRKYMAPDAMPLGTTRPARVEDKPRRRIAAADFPRLLDSAGYPQARIMVALGLYLCLRASEVVDLSVKDVNLDAGEILVYQRKTGRWDPMPITAELDVELRRWLTWYAQDVADTFGSIQPDWPLVPPLTGACFVGQGVIGPQRLNPTRRITQPHRTIQRVLRAFGWEEDRHEGGHTLRRSGARGLFDDLISSGDVRDDVLRMVSSMLHHKSVTITERYLGLEVDRERRNSLLKGRRMHRPAENVVELKRAGGAE